MDITVAFTVSGQRQKYLRQALASWARARGVQDARMLFCVEPEPSFPVPDFTAWAGETFSRVQVAVNPAVLGCLANTRQAMELAFGGGAGFAVLAEEDIEVSTDVLEYFGWAVGRYERDTDIMAACSHVLSSRVLRGISWPDAAVRLPWFSPLVWGTWKPCWDEFIGPGWGPAEGNAQGWDVHLREQLREVERACLFPVLSRSLHIGQASTLFSPELAAHMYPGTRSSCFSRDYPPQEWREVIPGPQLEMTV